MKSWIPVAGGLLMLLTGCERALTTFAPDEGVALEGVPARNHLPCHGTVVLTSQADVDAFNCTVVEDGGLIIESTAGDITNLAGLTGLTEVEGTLIIRDNPLLTDLDGLSDLTGIGCVGARITGNALLNDLSGLSSLANETTLDCVLSGAFPSVPGLSFNLADNPSLTGLAGLAGVPIGSLHLENNDALTSLAGVSHVTALMALGIVDNDQLGIVDGLDNLTEVGSLSIIGNSTLISLAGLSSLESVLALTVVHNGQFRTLQGLSSLESIGSGHPVHGMEISGNPLMLDIGLENLSGIDGDLSIVNNPDLNLCACAYYPLLDDVTGVIEVSGNGPKCDELADLSPGVCLDCAADLITSLLATTSGNGVIPQGLGNGLLNKLEQALAKFDAGQIKQALSKMESFIDQVSALEASGQIPPGTANALRRDAEDIIGAMEALA